MDPDGSLLWSIVVLAVLVLLCCVFVMGQTVVPGLNEAKLRKQAEGGDKKARLLIRFLDDPALFSASVRAGVCLSGFFAAALATQTFVWREAEVLADLAISADAVYAVSFVIVVLISALVFLTLGVFVPYRVAMTRRHEAIAMTLAKPLTVLGWILRPVTALGALLCAVVLRLFGIDPKADDDPVTEEEIRMLLDEGSEDGNIEESDKDMIMNIFDFDNTTVHELMTHRTEIVALELGATLRQVVGTAIESHYTRIPVCDDDLDNIAGILNVKDLLERITLDPDAPFDITAYLREPFYATESMSCKRLLSTLREKKLQVAVVVDEYGGTAGIITMEDLLEGIVGSIQDEYDDEEEEITALGAGDYILDGTANLEDVCKTLGLELSEDDMEEFETIGGYIIHRFGAIPEDDERPQIQIDDVLFTAQAVEEHRISKLRAQKITESPSQAHSG